MTNDEKQSQSSTTAINNSSNMSTLTKHTKNVSSCTQHEKLASFTLSPNDIEINDGVQRVYIDEIKDVGDGRLYKGQWNKKTGERDGVGI